MAASPISINRPQQAHHQHHSSGPINAHMNQPPAPGQGPYRMSFSPSDREYHAPQHHQQNGHDNTYSGIVSGAARSIFGSDDENYLPNQSSPMNSRHYGEHHQQQFLAHERLASIAERAAHQNGPVHAQVMGTSHQYTPLIPNRPAMPPPLSLEMQAGGYGGGGVPSPILPSPGGVNSWATVMAARRA